MPSESIAATFARILKKPNAKIKLLGDSITHGVGGSGWNQNGRSIVESWRESPDGYCWANLFRDHMKETYEATVINNGCAGTTVDFVISHFSTLVETDDDIIICTIGTNNRHKSFDRGEKPSREEFLQEFYEKIKRMYALFENAGIPTVFVANIPAANANEQDGEDYWRILHMNDINDSYKKLASESGATVLSLYDLFSEYCEKHALSIDELLSDGLHPNDRGYRVMFDLLVEALGV